jgi:hypothetical protein
MIASVIEAAFARTSDGCPRGRQSLARHRLAATRVDGESSGTGGDSRLVW